MVLNAGYSAWLGMAAGLRLRCLRTGQRRVDRLSEFISFIVTLGMFAVARSMAQVLSQNHMIYQFGPDEKLFTTIGGGTRVRRRQSVHRIARADDRLYDCLSLHHLGALDVSPSAATNTPLGSPA